MNTQDAVTILSCLAQEARLEIFRLLVQHSPEGLAAGEIGIIGRNTQGVRIMSLDDDDLLVAVKCVPPSRCGMLLVKHCTFSW